MTSSSRLPVSFARISFSRMGRKNRNKKAAPSNGASGSAEASKQLSKAAKKEIMDLIKLLLEKCSQPGGSGAKEFEDYLEIRGTVEKIRDLQKDINLVMEKREDKFPVFKDWLKNNKVDVGCVEIHKFTGLGHGLQATKDLKEGDQFLAIPRNIMMTTQSARSSALGPLISEDKILQVMPSVVLALHLLCERRSPESNWGPYLNILPESYNTPLYFTPEDLKYLKGSPAQSDCINQYRNIVRQYAYFYKLFQNDASSQNLPIKDLFTFDDYRWAVSTVMTRQNQIPTPDGSKMTFALIPLWDMCNHCNGLITTDFNLEKDCSECYSLRSYSKGDQIFIFYGARSNAELLVNNGFVYLENEHDRMAIKLGISKSDPLFSLKSEVLTRCGLLPSRTFYLHKGELPVDSDLLVFLRIFQMDEETLRGKFSEANAAELREELGDLEKVVSVDVEMKVWNYLETRSTLLMKAYDCTVEEDDEVMQKEKLSEAALLCVQLRRCEKIILKSAAAYAAQRKQKLQPSQETT
ncbi:actin-histidine N-methyltransferase-like isoform X2 [Mercenaria mercenaria]|uniref:actin-histidine N-methyltransferase-like isoform X2 n=1 Tax=Mercenaria mercenaria TaxID=6596 RepID=UPI00234E58C2|nr:actin-histidine N-methyltransferase-like isoform X2 [Mercenaria mercenaria]